MIIALDEARLSLLYPYHMVVDHQLNVRQVGSGLMAYDTGPRPGVRLLDYFNWPHPDPVGDIARIASQGGFLRLVCVHGRALFDGSAIPVEGGYLLAMNQIPAVFSLEETPLQMADFNHADPLVTGLLLVSMQRAMLDESLQMAHDLTEEREKNVYLIERIRRFAGYTAHDFNNLLSIIRLNCNRLLNAELSRSDALRIIGLIEETAARGSVVARELMTLANQRHDSPQRTVVDDLLAEQTGYFEHICGSKVHFAQDLGAPGQAVMASAAGLVNSVINLVINSRQAMPDGGAITIATGLRTATLATAHGGPAPCLVISVSDTGPGMSDMVMRRAFEPFFSTKPYGNGMGLASVREYALEMGGDVQCHSAPGQGTRIEILLPAMTDAALPAPRQVAAPGGSGVSVLVVEDEPFALEALSETLEALGFAVSCAASAEAGRLALESGHFDVLLSDVKLNDDNGIDLATLAWRDHRADRVILMSGYVPEEGELDQAWSFVRKPLDIASLVKMMQPA